MRELKSEDIRGFWSLENELKRCESSSDFDAVYEDRLPRLISAEFHNLNTFSADMSAFHSIRCTNGYSMKSAALMASFQSSLESHPMLSTLGFEAGMQVLMQEGACTSDFANDHQFRSSAVYESVYKALDTNYQMVIGIGLDPSNVRILGVNRKTSDFSDRERQKVCLVAAALRTGFSSMREKRQLREMVGALASVWGVEANLLSASELGLIADVISLQSVTSVARVRGVRRDTVDKQLAVIRGKLKVGTTNELLSHFLIQGP